MARPEGDGDRRAGKIGRRAELNRRASTPTAQPSHRARAAPRLLRPVAGSVGSFAEPPGAVGVARSGSD